MQKVDRMICDFIKKHFLIILFIIATLLAFFIRFKLRDFVSRDYEVYLGPWLDDLKTHGGILGIASYQGDYNAPYVTLLALLSYLPIKGLYTIKFLSIVFDFVLAISCGYLAKMLVSKNKNLVSLLTYSIVLFIPAVLTNSSMWGQCDSIYAAFVIISLIFLLKEKHWQSFVFLGLAFAFKLQFIFILPLYIILYLTQNKFSILNFLIIPLVDFVLSIPAILAGMPIAKLFTIYQEQSSRLVLVRNFPNIYAILFGDVEFMEKTGNVPYIRAIGLTITILLCVLLLGYIIYKKVKWNKEKIITLGLFILMLVTYFLPSMHDRYLYVGEVLSIIYFIAYRKNVVVPLILNFNAFITYSKYLGYNAVDYSLGMIMPLIVVAYGLVILYFGRYTLKFLANEEKGK